MRQSLDFGACSSRITLSKVFSARSEFSVARLCARIPSSQLPLSLKLRRTRHRGRTPSSERSSRLGHTVACEGTTSTQRFSQLKSLSTVSLNSKSRRVASQLPKIFRLTSKVLVCGSVIIAVTARPSTTKPRIHNVAIRFFHCGCSSQELTESREDFPEIHVPFLLTPLITNHADNLV
jgi:hypothetical protein